MARFCKYSISSERLKESTCIRTGLVMELKLRNMIELHAHSERVEYNKLIIVDGI